MSQKMKLGLFMTSTGHHAGGWRYPTATPGSPLDFKFYANIVKKAEQAKLDMVFFSDKLALDDIYGSSFADSVMYRPSITSEPITLISSLSAVTKHIKLAATASTTYHEPYHIARMFATLNHLSQGRVAWNVVTSTSDAEARNFGESLHLDHATRYERAEEFIEVVKKLWSSWDAGTDPKDKKTGVYSNKDHVHYIDHESHWFDVKGPLNVPLSEYGHPTIIQAGSSETFRELAVKNADIIFTVQPTLESAKRFYQDVQSRMKRHHRSQDSISILPGVMPIIGSTEKEAEEKRQYLDSLIHPMAGIAFMSGSMNYDLSQHDVDDKFPDIENVIRGSKGRFQAVIRKARQENKTLAEVGKAYAASRSHQIVVGTPNTISDKLQQWYEERACDGFNLMPPYMEEGFTEIVEQVVPELLNRKLIKEERVLEEPLNKFT
ncbi:LLM class flavin-dependent oxidoreductase [Alkalicoccobacillus porphyridii]|uniref:LLM class flavin-dependent oxidoreductase n=1 Tax=Alkalicoccobacillus porphyridii TaxID=2597270 RepID=A0A554A2E4_9BACI|nr:LLM class flavin-dependent oxidoreductase [Alkalicoccobacillus porphyridii]TSB47845.1 LLM class flavin-dependent oxidoreductase [Alkalicoccobacillus porphyridii]